MKGIGDVEQRVPVHVEKLAIPLLRVLLCYSLDGLNCLTAGCVAMSRNPLESFHYSSQAVDQNDLLVLARSSVGGKLPYNNHDTNTITLHRVKDFRSLALDLRQDFTASSG